MYGYVEGNIERERVTTFLMYGYVEGNIERERVTKFIKNALSIVKMYD